MELPCSPKFLSSDGDFVHVDDDDLDVAVVVEIADREAARGMRRHDARPRVVGDIEELLVAAVPVEQALLVKRLADAACVDIRIDVPVGDEDVLPAVVVEVEKARSPS